MNFHIEKSNGNPPVNITDSQKSALEKFSEFFNSKKLNVSILNGSAGTGKTTLLKILTDHLTKIDIPFSVCAPTGRAAQVLRSKDVKGAITIHSMIYSHDRIEEEKTEGDLIYFFNLKNNNDSVNTVYLIDEASMISNQYSEGEFLRFGSGLLLQDLIEFISPNESNQRKIIFIGDNNQLPPVNSSFSPALNKEYLKSLPYNLKVDEIKLTEIVRQANDSGIIKNANVIKENLDKDYYAFLSLDYTTKEFQIIDNRQIIKDFIGKFNNDKNNCILISYTNASAKSYNNAIRENLYSNPSLLEKGDRIIVIKNNHLYHLLNGEMGIVKEVAPLPEEVFIQLRNEDFKEKLVFRNVTLEFLNESNGIIEVRANILENLLDSPEAGISKKQQRALLAHFVNRHRGVKRSSKEFAELIQNDIYINCLLIKYGYAVTCHKAQGGEWDNVYFDFRHNSSYSTDYYRFCYTAITRAKKVLYAINDLRQVYFLEILRMNFQILLLVIYLITFLMINLFLKF